MLTRTVPLTEQESVTLQTIAQQTGKTQDDLLHEAVQLLIGQFQQSRQRYWPHLTKQKRHYRTETARQSARERFEKHFGTLNLSDAMGADNESIDADLAKAYASNNEGS